MGTIIKRGTSWRAVVRRVGHKTQTHTASTKYAAEKWMRDVEKAMDDSTFVPKGKHTGAALFEWYRDNVSPTKRGSRWEVVRINMFLRTMPCLKKPYTKIDRMDMQQVRDQRKAAGLSDATINRDFNLISSIFSHAKKERGLPLRTNPVSEIKRPSKSPHRTRRPSAAELKALDKHFKFNIKKPVKPGLGSKQAVVGWMIHIAIETGMRIGELTLIKPSYVHLKTAHVALPGDITKSGRPRKVPLSKRAVALFTALLDAEPLDEDYVFGVGAEVAGVYFKRACEELKIEDLHFHDLRHEAASRIAKKLDVLELCAMFGWQNPKMAMVYYNPTPQELAARLG
jgi:integrase